VNAMIDMHRADVELRAAAGVPKFRKRG